MENRKEAIALERILFTVVTGVIIVYIALHALVFFGFSAAILPDSHRSSSDVVFLFLSLCLSIAGSQMHKVGWERLPNSRSIAVGMTCFTMVLAAADTVARAGSLIQFRYENYSGLVFAFCAMGLYKLLCRKQPDPVASKLQISVEYLPRTGFEGLLERILNRMLREIIELPAEHPVLMLWALALIGAACVALYIQFFQGLYGVLAGIPAGLADTNKDNTLSTGQVFLFLVAGVYAFVFVRFLGRFFRSALHVPEWLGNGVILSPKELYGVGLLNGDFRGRQAWSDVHHIALCADSSLSVNQARERNTKDPCSRVRNVQLILNFRSGGHATIDLSRLSFDDLEKLFLAIESWANPLCCSPAVARLKNDILTRAEDTADSITYTQVWEQSLANSFVATNFVPLKAGHILLAGSLPVIKVLLPISSRGFSSVYIAEEATAGTRVILKEFTLPPRTDAAKMQKAHELFLREATILSHLDHPKIVKVLDHFVECGREYLLLEYVSGMNLRQLVTARGPQSEQQVLLWARELCEVLQYLHDQNPPVVHRDLTPDNVMLTKDGTIKLVDFGAARESVSKATGTLVGKQSYIAPEQFRGKASVQSDIYALGCTMHFLLTGRDPEALSESHPGESNPNVSGAVDDLVASCTRIDQFDRVKNAFELIARIEQIIVSKTAPPDETDGDGEHIIIRKEEVV